jgi:hypothetical protein
MLNRIFEALYMSFPPPLLQRIEETEIKKQVQPTSNTTQANTSKGMKVKERKPIYKGGGG